MGITIHYKITVQAKAGAEAFLRAARREARSRRWPARSIKDSPGGIEVTAHKDCDPIRLQFSRRLVCDEFTKTQYAPLRVHVAVVDYLRALQPLAGKMTVVDEGDYWHTSDRALLKRNRDGFDRAMGALKGDAGSRDAEFTFRSFVVGRDGSLTPANPLTAKPLRRRARRGSR